MVDVAPSKRKICTYADYAYVIIFKRKMKEASFHCSLLNLLSRRHHRSGPFA